jgi:hypothetical protein
MPRELSETLEAIDAAIEQFDKGENWIKRRDAADVLSLAMREIVLAAHRGATDEDPDVSMACKQMLQTLQQDLTADPNRIGPEVAAQRRTLSIHHVAAAGTPGSAAQSPDATPEDVREWLDHLAREAGTKVETDGGRLMIALPLKGGRTQRVIIDMAQSDAAEEAKILVYTLCGPAEPGVYQRALESNAKLSHAAFALLTRGDKMMLILVSRRRLSGLTRETFISDIRYIARKGDQAEEQLHPHDKH